MDTLGKPYKLVKRKLRGPPVTASMEYTALLTVIDALFPAHQLRADGLLVPTDPAVPFTAAEVDTAVARAGSRNKAPGPDGITSKILSAVHKADPRILLDLFNSCFHNGIFPSE